MKNVYFEWMLNMYEFFKLRVLLSCLWTMMLLCCGMYV